METNDVFEDASTKEKLSRDELKALGTRFAKTKLKGSSSSGTDSGSCHSAKLSKEDYKALEDQYKTVVPAGQGWYNHPSPSGHGGPTCFGILFKDYHWVTVKDFGYEWDKDELWNELEVTPIPYRKTDELGESVEHDQFIYLDENGVEVHRKIRYRFLDEDGELVKKDGKIKKKDFWFHKDDAGKRVPGMRRGPDGRPIHLLYHLPAIVSATQKGEVIWIPEGEKDADTIVNKLGYYATSGDSGSKSWRDEWVDVLVGGKTMEFIVPFDIDEDQGGEKHAWLKAYSLHRRNPQYQIKLISFSPYKDITDWVDAGGTQQELDNMLATIPYLTTSDFEEAGFQFEFFDGKYIERFGNFYYSEGSLWKVDFVHIKALQEEIAACADDKEVAKLGKELKNVINKKVRVGDCIEVIDSSLGVNGEEVGVALRFTTKAGVERVVNITLAELDEKDIRKNFTDKFDYQLEHHQNANLFKFILQQHYQRKTRSVRVNQTGWYRKTYVLPDRVIGVDKVVFATSEVAARFGTCGTLKEWQDNVIKYAAGNSVPLFCLSLGYAAITMGMCDYFVQNLAVNIMGGTSQGKTVSEKVPVSMIGPPNYLIQLSGTARSLKDMPRLHNHTLVVMDDISKLGDEGPKFAKEFSFDFEGGQQRSRLRTTGEQRHRDEWKTLALLSNEKSSVDMIKYDQLQGGHFVRFIDIPVENFGTYGVFENLHGLNNGKLFSQLLERNTSKYYGIGLEHFIKQLQDNWDESRKYLNERKGLFYRVLVQGRKISNEVGRVLEVFSHVIASAELATKHGVHGDYIKPNEMMVACKKLIDKWIEWRGGIEAKFDETRIWKKLQTHLDTEIGLYGWIEEGTLVPDPTRKDKIDVDDINDALSGTPALVEKANRGIKAGYRYVGKSDTHYALISVSYFKHILYQGENSRQVLTALRDKQILIPRQKDQFAWSVEKLHIKGLSEYESNDAKFYKIDYDRLNTVLEE